MFRSCKKEERKELKPSDLFTLLFVVQFFIKLNVVAHCMHVQSVNTQVKSCQVHGLEHLHECLTLALLHMHNLFRILLHGPFDKT